MRQGGDEGERGEAPWGTCTVVLAARVGTLPQPRFLSSGARLLVQPRSSLRDRYSKPNRMASCVCVCVLLLRDLATGGRRRAARCLLRPSLCPRGVPCTLPSHPPAPLLRAALSVLGEPFSRPSATECSPLPLPSSTTALPAERHICTQLPQSSHLCAGLVAATRPASSLLPGSWRRPRASAPCVVLQLHPPPATLLPPLLLPTPSTHTHTHTQQPPRNSRASHSRARSNTISLLCFTSFAHAPPPFRSLPPPPLPPCPAPSACRTRRRWRR